MRSGTRTHRPRLEGRWARERRRPQVVSAVVARWAYLICYILCYLISYRIYYSPSAATLTDMAEQLALRRRRRISRPKYQIRMLNLCKRKACL